MPADPAPWRAVAGGLEIRVRVTPRGGRDGIEGVEALSDGRSVLKVRVRVLAKSLGLPAAAVNLQAGAAARVKTFRIVGDPRRSAAALADLAAGRA